MAAERKKRKIDLWGPDNELTGRIKRVKWLDWSFIKSGIDMPFLIILLSIVAIGLVSLYSASYAYAYYYEGNSYHYITRQLIFAGLGIFALIGASFVPYQNLKKTWVLAVAFIGSLLLLGYVLTTHPESGIRRWIGLGIVSFQPSEVAKFAMILVFAHLMSVNHKQMKTFKYGFLLYVGILLVMCALVLAEPHLSGTMLLLLIGLVMMFVGGTRGAYLGGLIAVGIVAVVMLVFVLGYEQDRIIVWQDPVGVFESNELLPNGQTGRDGAWQTVQSLYAIGSGGFMGQGLGNSRQKHLFLPEPQNDFIFSIVCEELGFVGAVVIIVLFGLLVWRGFVIGMRAKDKFGSLLAIGLTAQIGLQVMLNLMVVTNIMPNTGISLPFFSYGGTSLVMLLAQMGIVLSVSRQTNKEGL